MACWGLECFLPLLTSISIETELSKRGPGGLQHGSARSGRLEQTKRHPMTKEFAVSAKYRIQRFDLNMALHQRRLKRFSSGLALEGQVTAVIPKISRFPGAARAEFLPLGEDHHAPSIY